MTSKRVFYQQFSLRGTYHSNLVVSFFVKQLASASNHTLLVLEGAYVVEMKVEVERGQAEDCHFD